MSTLNKQLQERIESIIGPIGDRNDYMVGNFIHLIRSYPATEDWWNLLDRQQEEIVKQTLFQCVAPEPTTDDLLLALNTIRDEKTSYCLYSNGGLERTIRDCETTHFYAIILDLSLSIFSQSDEVKQKLLDLLK